MRFSANIGFLWPDLPLVDRIHAAAKAGFGAVECHFPYDTDPEAVRRALAETRLGMLGLNTVPGDVASGDFGLAAMPGRETEARDAIEQAFDYASEIDAPNVHVMAGKSRGLDGGERCFRDNLAYAAERAARDARWVLIEPINLRDAPGYAIATVEEAAAVIGDIGSDRVRIMFDCYHLQIGGGDLLTRFTAHRDLIGHVQFAAVPSRGTPDRGEVNYPWLLPAIADAGYDGWFGAEYRPEGPTGATLGWMADYG